MKLSLLVCTIPSRAHLLQRLLDRLKPQLTEDVELLIDLDDGDVSIGVKRQRLLERASGDYIAYIDDDDLVHERYVPLILEALKTNPDCVGFKSNRYVNGKHSAIAYYSRRHRPDRWVIDENGFKTVWRCCNHLNPVRREIALQIGFKDKDKGEDCQYAGRIKRFLKQESYIDEFLYEYYYRDEEYRAGEMSHAIKSALQVKESGAVITPLDKETQDVSRFDAAQPHDESAVP